MNLESNEKNLINDLLNPDLFLDSCEKRKIVISTYPYKKIESLSLNDSLLVSLLILNENQNSETVNYGDWYAQIFLLFPMKFGISSEYPMLLDSEKINKRWRDLKTRGLIEGSRASGWNLTPPGKTRAKEILDEIGHPTGKKIEIKSLYSLDIKVLIQRFQNIDVFKEWDKVGIPEPATMNEISTILGINVGVKRQELGQRLLEILVTGGVLDKDDEIIKKARKWLLYQCLNLRRFMGEGSTFNQEVNKIAKELDLILPD